MESFKFEIDTLLSISPSQYCQAFYILSSAAILIGFSLPTKIKGAFFDYGARCSSGQQQQQRPGLLVRVLDSLQVPHSWFLHFYVLSTGLSLFWAWQYVTQGYVLSNIVAAQVREGSTGGLMMSQVAVGWIMMFAQGSRRLYESVFVTRPGKVPMSGLHWLLGLLFYMTMSVAVWIEGSGAIIESWETGKMNWEDYPAIVPLAVGTFITASLKQNELHAHLSSLKKYTLPSGSWFQHIICPHYSAECLIYVSISMVTAPAGNIVNKTILAGLIFVVVNLGGTAGRTKDWYEQKFGAKEVAKRWRMIPFLW